MVLIPWHTKMRVTQTHLNYIECVLDTKLEKDLKIDLNKIVSVH